MRRLLVVLTLLCALGVPATALADTATGGAEIALKGRLAGHFVATDPATATSAKLSVPGYEGTVSSTSATLTHSGVVQVKTKRARLNLVSLRTTLGSTSKTTALVGGKRIALFTYGGKPTFTQGSASLNAAKAKLAPAAAKAIKKALGLKQLANVKVGTATITISTRADTGGAQQITWRPRESFIRYMNSETGSLTVSGGAQEGPKEVRPGTDVPLVYSFVFPNRTGTLSAKWEQRGIDLSFTDPQITGNMFSVVYGGATSGDYAGKRVDMLLLDPSKTTEQGDVPARLTEDGSKAFAGFYSPGDEFGTVRAATASGRRSARIARKRKKKLRIVALSPFTANTLVDLGIKPIAIANTLGGQDRFRRQLKGVKRLELSHPNGPNLEQLASLDPDVVLSSPTWSRGHKAMRELGMKVELADPTSVASVPAMTRKLGRLVGKRKRAEEIATLQEETTEDAEIGIKSHPRVLAVLGVGRAPYAFLPNSWGGDLVIRSGGQLLGEDLSDKSGFAKISDEKVVAYNPEVIIAVPHGSAKDIPSIKEYLQNNPSWKNTDAGRNDRIYVATDNAMLQPFTDPGRTIRDIGGDYLSNR